MAKQGFDFGRVISGALWMLQRDAGVLVPIVLIWSVLNFILFSFNFAVGLGFLVSQLILSILSMPTLIGAVTALAFSNRSLGSMGAISFALSRFWLLLVAYVLSCIGFIIGSMLLIIPGLVIAVMWTIVFPILIAEDKDPVQALDESYSRVRENFMPIAGLLICFIILNILVRIILDVLGLASFAGEPSVGLGFEAFTSTLFSVIGAYLNVAIYKELSNVSGPDITVFD